MRSHFLLEISSRQDDESAGARLTGRLHQRFVFYMCSSSSSLLAVAAARQQLHRADVRHLLHRPYRHLSRRGAVAGEGLIHWCFNALSAELWKMSLFLLGPALWRQGRALFFCMSPIAYFSKGGAPHAPTQTQA